MEYLKALFFLLLTLVLSFGLWFLVGWFISSESNMLLWPWYGKLFYLIFSWSSIRSLLDYFSQEF